MWYKKHALKLMKKERRFPHPQVRVRTSFPYFLKTFNLAFIYPHDNRPTASIMRWTTTQQTDHFSCFHPFMFIVRCTRTNLINFIGRVSFEKEDISYIPERVYRTSAEKEVQTDFLDDENEVSTDEEKGMLKKNLNDTNKDNSNVQEDEDDSELEF